MFSHSQDSFTSDPMYSCVQRFHVKNNFGEERVRELRIIVDFTSFRQTSQNVLHIQVLDDDDPFFYYSLNLTETDYLRVKSSQGLLVDFCSFPTQVLRLLEQCKNHEGGSAKFLLILEEEGRGECSKTMFKIVETNNFKHLCHLVLQLDHGSDEDVKNIMVRKIKALKEHQTKAEKIIMSLESQLTSKNLMLETAQLKAAEMEDRWKNEKLSYQEQTAKGLSEETDKLRKAQLDWQIRSQREKAEVEEKCHATLRDKDAELSKIRLENQILSDKRSHAEAALAEQSKRVELLEKELMSVRSDLANARKNATKSDAELRDHERTTAHYKVKLASLEHELKDKNMLMARQEEIMKNLQEHKTRLEGALSEKEAYISKKQKTIQNVSEELIKANEIIAKLQKELNSLTMKLKTRTDIALEQEKVIDQHVRAIERLEKDLKLKTKKLESLDSSEEGLKTKLKELQELLDDKERKIKENEKIIDWLNRRCTEQAVQSYSPSYGNVDTPGAPQAVKPLVSGTPLATISANEFKTSTPLERFKEVHAPFTMTPPGRFNVAALDKMVTPPIREESENDDPSPKAGSHSPVLAASSAKDQVDPKSFDKKKASPVDPPKMSSKTRKPTVTSKQPLQPPVVPSSYFFS